MPALKPFSYPKGGWKLPKLRQFLAKGPHHPPVGVTQGGSSRPGAPAKVAATNGLAKPMPFKQELLQND